MPAVLLQSLAGALLLVVAALWPRAGEPVLLALPPGVPAAAAFGLEGWRVLRVTEAGAVALVALAPEGGASSPGALLAASGAMLALRAGAAGGCLDMVGGR
ncbi:MAG: hypothetical protein NZM27_12920 [Acetobacteraceae bacterium]|nr:hypothetical protein [Acetobacteraceae bacterium]MCX7685618.1 hypothetical protein [Acetobacteraceae bacterium]MDW8397985.1 hypothetical protein [Acetobacteraceae bacterium]